MFKKRGEPKQYRGFFAHRKPIIATATLVGTMVGAGILAIPYVVAKAGALYGFLLLLVLGFTVLQLNLFVGEFILRTKGKHQLMGYVGKYLGPWGKRIMTSTMVFTMYGALTAYLIGEGETLHTLFPFGSSVLFTFLFFFATFFIIYKGIKATGRAELVIISALILIVALIGIFSYDQIVFSNFTGFNPQYLFLPYGIIFFAYLGVIAVPEMREELGEDTRYLKKAIIIGSLVTMALYLLFTFVVVGIVGLGDFEVLTPNERIATIALSVYAHPIFGVLANVLAMLSMFSSYIAIGTGLVQAYSYDYNIHRRLAVFLVVIPPLLITLFKLTTFIAVLAVTGSLAGGIEGTMLILTYWKAKVKGNRVPEYSLPKHRVLGILMICLFLLGMAYYLLRNFF